MNGLNETLMPLQLHFSVSLPIFAACSAQHFLLFRYLALPDDIGPAAEKRSVGEAAAAIKGFPCVPFADGRLVPYGDARFSSVADVANLPPGATILARKLGLVEIHPQ